jgi:hypothetical protein
MKDIQAQLEKLRADAAKRARQCAVIRDWATDPQKRELFTKLADHFLVLTSEVERTQLGK